MIGLLIDYLPYIILSIIVLLVAYLIFQQWLKKLRLSETGWIVFILASSILQLSACVSSSGPEPIGENEYMLSQQEDKIPLTTDYLIDGTVEEAEEHCNSLGKTIKINAVMGNLGPNDLFARDRTSVAYTCIDAK